MTVLGWAAATADAGVAVPLVADAQPARKPTAITMAARTAAARLGEGFMVPPRNAHHTVRRGGGGNGWADAAGAGMAGRRGGGGNGWADAAGAGIATWRGFSRRGAGI